MVDDVLHIRRAGPSRRVRVHEFDGDHVRHHEDRVTTEEPLEIRVGWPGHPAERVSVTMRTPGHDFELSTGWLRGEGMLRSYDDLHTVAYCTDHTLTPDEKLNVVTVTLARPPWRPPSPRYDGPGAGSSACGVCGTRSIDDVLSVTAGADATSWTGLTVAPSVVRGLPDALRAAQRVFERTGGLHAAGLFTDRGETLVVREDVGRHNAVDKVFGARILAQETTAVPLLCVSGRIGFELVQKAIVGGVALIAAVGAPTSLAVDLAARTGLCVVGFVRGDRFVTYTAPERIGV